MADIQFQEEDQLYRRPVRIERKPLLTRIVLSTGLATTDEGVQKVLLAVAVISAVLAIGIFIYSNSGGGSSNESSLPPNLQARYAK